ncbi:MAG: hypothetical protein H7343_12225 [Undibacterium sp.]|nr:hypothetical protein [Opitutaceae bacterium]
MNTITQSAQKITSITLSKFIAAGGELLKLETLNRGDGADREIHVFEIENHDGAYISDNSGVSWFDADFSRVVEGLRSGDVSDLPEARGIAAL